MTKKTAGAVRKSQVFIPLTKVDEDQHLVYGRITQEMLDKSKEVMDYTSSVPYFKSWSDEVHTNSGGLSKGNVRVMHSLKAAGKLTEMDFNDEDMAIDVCAKIVDEEEWQKVVEGVYTGFSVGGNYAKRWTDTVDGEKIKKFTAAPNEVSLVDNPCVPSATFSLIKADGTESAVPFAVQNDDEEWPGFAKAASTEEPEEPTVDEQLELDLPEPTNSEIVSKAEEMAKAVGPEASWTQYVEAARNELTKAMPAKKEKKKPADETPAGDDTASPDAKASKKVTPTGVKQVWATSDGATFSKKEEAVTHEATLVKAEKTEAEKLADRLAKALNAEEPTGVSLMDDWDRMAKVIEVIQTPHSADGSPILEKGMYTVSNFARTLWDLGSLIRRVKSESVTEGDDPADTSVADSMKEGLSKLAESFKAYVEDQITELMSGIDDDVCVATYDYYYAAAQADPENELAKDACEIINKYREPSREHREVLSKLFQPDPVGIVEESTSLQKRFDDLQVENTEFKKIASEAVEAVEALNKRVAKIEDTPLPRAPRNVVLKEGDTTFMGKAATTEEDKMAILGDMLKAYGPDKLATMMIKASQASGGAKLHLAQGS